MRSVREAGLTAAAALVLVGCATSLGAPAATRVELRPVGEGVWDHLRRGDAAAAAAAWGAATSGDRGDLEILFARTMLAYEQVDARAALPLALDLLEQAAAAPEIELAGLLADATAARLGPLFEEAGTRAAEDRVLGLTPARRSQLPWRARLALAWLADDLARRRGDAGLLTAQARQAGCVPAATLVAKIGRLPTLDLGMAMPPGDFSARALPISGCRIALPVVDGQAGVLVVNATITADAGAHDLVIDYPGLALLRVDGGDWHAHGSTDHHGPRWSAARRRWRAGRHVIELRLPTYGIAGEVGLAIMPLGTASRASDGEGGFTGTGAGAAALINYAMALRAELSGDANLALGGARRLTEERRFALGQALAGWIVARDVSRPANLTRDAARTLFDRAVAVDPQLARVWLALGEGEAQENRLRAATRLYRRATVHAPGAWRGFLALAQTLLADGFESEADQALDQALALVGGAGAGCAVIEEGARRARRDFRPSDEDGLLDRLVACDARTPMRAETLARRGKPAAALDDLARARAVAANPDWIDVERLGLLLAMNQAGSAAAVARALVDRTPREPSFRVRLANALSAGGQPAAAEAELARAVAAFPHNAEIRRAARAIGMPLPLDPWRVDGAAVVRAFDQSGRRFEAPAVVLLDRTVERIEPDGRRAVLTHNVVRVQSKEGIDRWGEVAVPQGAEVLTLRTLKADGRRLEPEDIAGKETVSAPELQIGDSVEWEILEFSEPDAAFAPGFLGARFFFASLEAPLDRSEYVLLTPRSLPVELDRRAGAPAATTRTVGDWRESTLAARQIPLVVAERSPTGLRDWLPSVRAWSGVTLGAWSRLLSERLVTLARDNPDLRLVAAGLRAEKSAASLPERIVRFVGKAIEAEGGLDESASFTLARGRGSRLTVAVALARLLGLKTEVIFARSLLTADRDEPVVLPELAEFAEPVIGFPSGERPAAGSRFADLRFRHASLGYLPPGLDGAPAFVVGEDRLIRLSRVAVDGRVVRLRVDIDRTGRAQAVAHEDLLGLPAFEWAEALEQTGQDSEKQKRDFEQGYLAHHFPGAQLESLSVTPVPGDRSRIQIDYRFSVQQFARPDKDGLTVVPGFFRAQLGRRYATEPARRTPLLLNTDVPLQLEADLFFPAGAKVAELGASVRLGVETQFSFVEERRAPPAANGAAPLRVRLQRDSRISISRIAPASYPASSASLRRVDQVESAPIRVTIPGQ